MNLCTKLLQIPKSGRKAVTYPRPHSNASTVGLRPVVRGLVNGYQANLADFCPLCSGNQKKSKSGIKETADAIKLTKERGFRFRQTKCGS